MSTNPYLRESRKHLIRDVITTAVWSGIWLLLSYLVWRHWPSGRLWVSALMWGGIVLLVVWRRFYIVRRRATHALAEQRMKRGHCPNCGYDRQGLDQDVRCPECGKRMVVVDVVARARRLRPQPEGRPVCVRCGADMTGRDERPCPTCGVHHGIDYVKE